MILLKKKEYNVFWIFLKIWTMTHGMFYNIVAANQIDIFLLQLQLCNV